MRDAMRRIFLFLTAACLVGGCVAAGPAADGVSDSAAGSRPNVVVIFTDDQGYQDLGCFGSPDIRTPHIDALAAQGMRLTDFYSASPVCSASRAALLTGRYPGNLGVRKVYFPNRGQGGMAPEHVTIAEMLRGVGYATQAVGKWHLGDEPTYLPTNQGFDGYYGIPYSNDMSPAESMAYAEDCLFREDMSPQRLVHAFAESRRKKERRVLTNRVPLMRDTVCVEFPADQSTITRRYTDEAIAFIDRSVAADRPFFLYLAHTMPHTPLAASEAFAGKSARGLYGDVIEEIDFNVGRLTGRLDELGVADNTLVVYTSDNGPWLVKGKDGGSALPLFEGKMTHFEGGQRVPAVVRWPGRVPAGSTSHEMMLTMDLLPTLAHVAGAPLPDAPLDGRNVIGLLTGEPGATTPHRYFFYADRAVRSGDWKYHAAERFKVKATARPTGGPTLYNLRDDIGESRNVIDEHPEVAERLRQALDQQKAVYEQAKQGGG